MTTDEVKHILRRAFAAKCAVKSVEYKIKELESLRERVTPSYSAMPGGGSGNKIEDITEKICGVREKLADKIKVYLDEAETAEKLIQVAEYHDTMMGVILRQRYITGCAWWRIAKLNNYSRRQVFRIHDRAVAYIADNMKTWH